MKVDLTKEEGEAGIGLIQMAIDVLERQSARTVNPTVLLAFEKSIEEAKMLQQKMRFVSLGQSSL